MKAVPALERPDLDERWDEIVRGAWPAFMLHDPVCNELWGRLFEGSFGPFQFFLLDDSDEMLAIAVTVPFAWDGQGDHLPDGVDGVLPLAVEQRDIGVPSTTLCALEGVVAPGHEGRGLSHVLVHEMRELAWRYGLSHLVAPVRPNRKASYPLMPMERYVRWRRDDGLPFDPWLRVHARAGAEVLGVCPNSMRIPGSVADWEGWTGMAFPETGEYVVPGALVPVRIDREQDLGVYVEPNVWVRHRVG